MTTVAARPSSAGRGRPSGQRPLQLAPRFRFGPVAFAAAASRAASSMNTSVLSAHTRPRRSSALSAVPRQAGPRRLPWPWPSSPARSRRRIRSGHPAGERPVPAVVRRFEEHRLPELVVAAVARDLDVSHAAAAAGRFPGRLAEARRPAHLCLAGPQLVTERTGFGLVLEQRSGHLNDHGLTSCHESMIIVTCMDDRPCRVTAQVSRLTPRISVTISVVPQKPRRVLAGATAASLRPACSARWPGVDAQQDVFRRHVTSVNVPTGCLAWAA